MFFALYSCYFCNLLTLFLLILTALQGYFSFPIYKANHATMAMLTMIIYMFTQTLIIFFFTGMGVNIRDYVASKQLDKTLYEENKKIKFVLFKHLLINIFFFIVLCVTGAPVQTHRIPAMIHGLLFWGVIFHYLSILKIEIGAFQSTVNTVLVMTQQERLSQDGKDS